MAPQPDEQLSILKFLEDNMQTTRYFVKQFRLSQMIVENLLKTISYKK
jgi:hypothetical protein